MDNRQWAELPQTQAFREKLTKRKGMLQAALDTAIRESTDPKVKAAYDNWKDADENLRALEGASNG